MTKKQLYETPEAEVLVVKIERSVLTGSPTYGTTGSAGGDTEDEDYGGF